MAVMGLYALVAVDKPRLARGATPLELTLAALPNFGVYMKTAALIGLSFGCFTAVWTGVYWIMRAWASKSPYEFDEHDRRFSGKIAMVIILAVGFSGLFAFLMLIKFWIWLTS